MTGAQAFAALAAAYDDRLALARGADRQVVGYVGNTVPVELIAASGARPLRIAPADGDTTAADAFVESFTDRDARLVFARFVEGAYDALSLLVLSRSSETWHKLYLALREAVRTGLKTDGPPLWLHDVPHTQRDSSRRYGLARTADLAQRLTALSGQPIDDARLRDAIAQGNALRRLLQHLQALRQQRRVAGVDAQLATGAPRFMDAAQARRLLEIWLASLPAQGPVPGATGARLAVHGVPLDHAELHRAVQAAGAGVVMEDDDWGSRAAAPLIDEGADPLTAVFEHYWRDVPCLRIHPAPAGEPGFVTAHRQGLIDGVIFHLPRPDDVHGWHFPAWRRAAEAAGVPWLQLRDDARDAATRPALRRSLQGFIQGLTTPAVQGR